MHNKTFYTGLFLFLTLAFQTIAKDYSQFAVKSDTMRITVSDGTELFVEVRGEGIPCLYIHGGPGVGSYWMEKLYGDVLEKHFKMIYLDQRGSGRSASAQNENYSPERIAKDFEEIRKALGIEAWVTFSHSFGGLLQMEHARLYPNTIRGMMLVESTINLKESIEGMINYSLDFLDIQGDARQPYLDKSKDALDRLIPLFGKLRERGEFWKIHYGDPQNYEIMDSVMAEVPNPNKEFGRRALGIGDYYKNYKPLTAEMTMPVLLYYGKRDYSVGPEHYKDMLFPHAMVRTWEGGHVPFMEGKKELDNAIAEWIATLD
ncbi:MAG: alpha/beta hydrolase [Balneolaceae bacterium]|jgi:proline iminopeptidase